MKAVIGFFVGCIALCIIPWVCVYELIVPQDQNYGSCEKSKDKQC